MPDKFQSTNHGESTYNRPNQEWLCGSACDDCPCFLGPDGKGNCQAGKSFDGRRSGQCLPRKQGDRWSCARGETHGMPPCEQGPLPDGSCCMEVPTCQPKRSLRRLRGLTTWGVVGATAAWLVVVLAPGDNSAEPTAGLNPGGLSANHSFLSQQCSACHADQSLTPASLAGLHRTSATHRAVADGGLCLECHSEIGGEENRFAFSPHTTAPLDRSDSTARKLMTLAMAEGLAGNPADGSLACSTCHREHHGPEADIAALGNAQCQSCHQEQFVSFSQGHPEFGQSRYPYKRRTALRFDHYSHYQTHFAEELGNAPDTVPEGFDPEAPHGESRSCRACHEPGPSGGPMVVRSFEVSCAACHEGEVLGGTPLAFLAFPSLDRTTLDAKLAELAEPRSVGTWIDEAPENFPWPVLHLLPEEARKAWLDLQSAGVDPFSSDLSGLDPDALAQVEKVAWEWKALARDLSQNQPHENPSNQIGHGELEHRLKAAGFGDAPAMINGLPPGSFDAMRRGFSEDGYRRLLSEVEAYRQGTLPPPVKPAAESPDTDNDPGTDDQAPSPDDANEEFGGETGESFGDDSGEEFGGETEESFGDDSGEEFGGETEESFGDDSGEEFGGETEESFGDDSGEEFGGETEESFGDDSGEEFGGGTEESFGESFEDKGDDEEEASPSALPELEAIDPENWAGRGGWYQQYGALYYRSTGHADPLLRAWLDELASRSSEPLALAHLRDGFDFRAGVDSVVTGHCLKCHAVDEVRDPAGKRISAKIHWQSLGKTQRENSLTHYHHASHLLLTDCRSCHQTSAKEGYLASFPARDDWNGERNWSNKADPTRFTSSFASLSKTTCASCHQPGVAGDSCLQCHKYHDQRTLNRHRATKLLEQAPKPPAGH